MHPVGLEKMYDIARHMGGTCLSTSYQDCKTPLKFKCLNGHEWQAIPDSIARGSWCRKCSYIERGNRNRELAKQKYKYKIQEFNQLVRSKGFELIDTEYAGYKSRYTMKCSVGHTFSMRIDAVKNGHGCKQCYFDSLKTLTIEDCRILAAQKGGTCLSDKYERNIRLQWECSKGHRWKIQYNNIKQGSWCPRCKNKTEDDIRSVFEKLLNKEFPQSYPRFLSLSRYRHLQLDGFNEELKLAFEYDGPHHFKKVVYKGKPIDLEKQKERDRIKDELCEQNGVRLIRIKYTIKNKEAYIRKRLREIGVYDENN